MKRDYKFGEKRLDAYWGYIWVFVGGEEPLFPGKRWVLEHRLKMARKLKRRLRKNEIVHHDDEDKTNNRITNLVLTTRAKHVLDHPRVLSEETKRKISAAAKRWSSTPEFCKMASERAKKQHAEGKLGRATWSAAVAAQVSEKAKQRWKEDSQYRKKVLDGLLNQSFSRKEMRRRSYCRKMFL
jgi:hypothetical protein